MRGKKHIVVVHPENGLYEKVSGLFNDQASYKISWAKNISELEDVVHTECPDVALGDFMCGEGENDKALRRLTFIGNCKFLSYTACNSSEYIVKFIESGGHGWIENDSDDETVFEAIHTMLEGIDWDDWIYRKSQEDYLRSDIRTERIAQGI